MNDPHRESHLSRILTNPTVLENPTSFFEVYEVPIRKFFACLCGSSEQADEQFQDFAVKFLEGAFRSFKPEKGRFRDYLKSSLRNQVKKSMRRNRVSTTPMSDSWDLADPSAMQPVEKALREFDAVEGQQIKLLVDQDMQTEEQAGKNRFHSLLQFAIRYQQRMAASAKVGGKSKMPVAAIVQFFAEHFGETVSEETARQRMFRAKSTFASKMISEIATRIGDSSTTAIRAAASELALSIYVEKELDRRR